MEKRKREKEEFEEQEKLRKIAAEEEERRLRQIEEEEHQRLLEEQARQEVPNRLFTIDQHCSSYCKLMLTICRKKQRKRNLRRKRRSAKEFRQNSTPFRSVLTVKTPLKGMGCLAVVAPGIELALVCISA